MHDLPSFYALTRIISHPPLPCLLITSLLTSVPCTHHKFTYHFTFISRNPSRLICSLSKSEVKAGELRACRRYHSTWLLGMKPFEPEVVL